MQVCFQGFASQPLGRIRGSPISSSACDVPPLFSSVCNRQTQPITLHYTFPDDGCPFPKAHAWLAENALCLYPGLAMKHPSPERGATRTTLGRCFDREGSRTNHLQPPTMTAKPKVTHKVGHDAHRHDHWGRPREQQDYSLYNTLHQQFLRRLQANFQTSHSLCTPFPQLS